MGSKQYGIFGNVKAEDFTGMGWYERKLFWSNLGVKRARAEFDEKVYFTPKEKIGIVMMEIARKLYDTHNPA